MNKKLTIGLFNDSFFPMTDGVVMVVDNYAKRLCKFANVIVFVPAYHGKKYDDSKFPYKVVRCHSMHIHSLDYSVPVPKLDLKFKKELKKYNLDIVHIHSPFGLGIQGVSYAKKHKIPCVGTMHSQFRQDFEKFIKSKKISNLFNKRLVISLFNKCDECWAVNSEIARIFYEDYGYKELPKVMNNATDMQPIIDKKKTNDEINELYNIDNKTKVFLFVGRINTLKNILFIIDALNIIKNKNKFDFRMIFVGTGEDEDKLKEKVKKMNLEDKVIMTGKIVDRNQIAKYYARADLFLFPSVYDASSLVQIEAASQETPTVFIRGTATSATTTENVNSFMSDNNYEDFAKRIIDVMEDTKLYNRVSSGAYNDLYKSWDDMVEDVYHRYIDLIKKYKKEKE